MSRGTIAIVGRPNVGKSTLFNRIVGEQKAIVHDEPGVTRDRQFGRSDWAGRDFWVIDTGGWTVAEDAVSRGVRSQIETAVESADVILFVVDTQEGIHPGDAEVAEMLRPSSKRVIVTANKADDLSEDISHVAFHELGFEKLQPVSAATGKGSGDLLDTIVSLLPELSSKDQPDSIDIAVVGRPNVGNSSLVNRLLGEERLIVAPEAGTTRDAIDSPIRYHGRTFNFIDTAGLRKRSKVASDIEFYSRVRTERALHRADVCVLVADATQGMEKQDVQVAEHAWECGCGLIVGVNKWDLIPDKDPVATARFQRQIAERVPFFEGVPFVFISALTGQRIRRILDLILSVTAEREKRVATAEVNKVLQQLVQKNQPPQKPGRPVNLLYGSQIAIAPPTFALVSNRPDIIPESYLRYLIRGFRREWGFAGSPLRVRLQKRRDGR